MNTVQACYTFQDGLLSIKLLYACCSNDEPPWTFCCAVFLVLATLSELLNAVSPVTIQLHIEVPVHTGSELLEKMCTVNTVLSGSL